MNEQILLPQTVRSNMFKTILFYVFSTVILLGITVYMFRLGIDWNNKHDVIVFIMTCIAILLYVIRSVYRSWLFMSIITDSTATYVGVYKTMEAYSIVEEFPDKVVYLPRIIGNEYVSVIRGNGIVLLLQNE